MALPPDPAFPLEPPAPDASNLVRQPIHPHDKRPPPRPGRLEQLDEQARERRNTLAEALISNDIDTAKKIREDLREKGYRPHDIQTEFWKAEGVAQRLLDERDGRTTPDWATVKKERAAEREALAKAVLADDFDAQRRIIDTIRERGNEARDIRIVMDRAERRAKEIDAENVRLPETWRKSAAEVANRDTARRTTEKDGERTRASESGPKSAPSPSADGRALRSDAERRWEAQRAAWREGRSDIADRTYSNTAVRTPGRGGGRGR